MDRQTMRHRRKPLASHCLTVDLWALGLSSKDRDRKPLAVAGTRQGRRGAYTYEADTAAERLRLGHLAGGKAVGLAVRLTTTPLPWGGLKWWMICPGRATACGRRVRKLYLPAGGSCLACRLCHNLTYESAQTAHRDDALWATVAGGIGCSMADARRAWVKMQRRKRHV